MNPPPRAMDDHLVPRLPVDTETIDFHGWTITYTKSHILKSICTNNRECVLGTPECCDLCTYGRSLELAHLPDMVFHKNKLSLHHKNGYSIEFTPMEALKLVGNTSHDQIKVACADEWRQSRPESLMEEKLKPFDWTFTTDYQGTLSDDFEVQPTSSKLNIFKLMQKESLLFYQDVCLFEDELHDNGISQCSAKIRVMPSGFFILCRHFVRVDNVKIKINDTRYHYEIENDYILREFTAKEAKADALKSVPPSLLTLPHEIEKMLPVIVKTTEKLIFKK